MRAAILALALVGAGPAPARADRPTPPPAPAAPRSPIRARVIEYQLQGKDAFITLDRGDEVGVAVGWLGHLVDDHDRAVPHGDFTIVRVTRRTSTARVRLPGDVVATRSHAVIAPPSSISLDSTVRRK